MLCLNSAPEMIQRMRLQLLFAAIRAARRSLAASITNGIVFRAINKAGHVWGDGMSPKVIWDVVRVAAARANIDKPAPPDLRRTCARLCHLL